MPMLFTEVQEPIAVLLEDDDTAKKGISVSELCDEEAMWPISVIVAEVMSWLHARHAEQISKGQPDNEREIRLLIPKGYL